MLNPNIFSRHCKKSVEHMEQVEQPHKYRAFLFHVPQNKYGTHGTNLGIVPPVPYTKNAYGTEITASILAVPCVPSVPSENMPEMKKRGIYPQEKRRKYSDHVHYFKGKGKTGEGFPVPAWQNPNVFCHVAPVLMNRRRRIGRADTPDDGNSKCLKREPYPFQTFKTQYLAPEFGFLTKH